MTTHIQLICPDCGGINRVSAERLEQQPLCGKCRSRLLNGVPLNISDQQFSRFITNTGLPVVVDFWATWCGPCQQFAPVFSDIAAIMNTEARFIKLNTEANPQTAARYQIRSIPTLMLFYQGKETTRLSGALPKSQFEQWLRQQLVALQK